MEILNQDRRKYDINKVLPSGLVICGKNNRRQKDKQVACPGHNLGGVRQGDHMEAKGEPDTDAEETCAPVLI